MQQNLESILMRVASRIDAGLASFREVRRIYDAEIAFDFNPINFFNLDENTLSQIIAFFLNPKESHGQNKVFLQIFLDHFSDSSAEVNRAALKLASNLLKQNVDVRIATEDPTECGRRIDITVRFLDKCAIGIENKVWAPDQTAQLCDYAKSLAMWSSQSFLFYLSPFGREPSPTSLEAETCKEMKQAGTFSCISYVSDIMALLAKFDSACRADNVRRFIRDLGHYIRKRFSGAKSMEEIQVIKAAVLTEPAICKHLSAITQAVEAIRADCLSVFWKGLRTSLSPEFTLGKERLKDNNSICDLDGLSIGLKIEVLVWYELAALPTSAPVTVSINFGDPEHLSAEIAQRIDALQSKLREKFGEGAEVSGWWLAAAPVSPFRLDNESLAKLLQDGNVDAALCAAGREAADRINEYSKIVQTELALA